MLDIAGVPQKPIQDDTLTDVKDEPVAEQQESSAD